jgi:hypothetical protein
VDYDRIICRKDYVGGNYTYTPIANLSTSMDWDVPSGSIEKITVGGVTSNKIIWCGKILDSDKNEYTLNNTEDLITIDEVEYAITYISETYGVFGANEFLKSFDTIAYNHLYGI